MSFGQGLYLVNLLYKQIYGYFWKLETEATFVENIHYLELTMFFRMVTCVVLGTYNKIESIRRTRCLNVVEAKVPSRD